jgi:uncharacterized SAM-dependent methyltransferase
MPKTLNVTVHQSQFPDAVRRDLIESLRSGRINHKFLYDSFKQTQLWLELHQACSPSRTDADCSATYDRSFEAVAPQLDAKTIHLVGLGCGGGQKDTRLLELLLRSGKNVSYTACDVSVAMTIVAAETARTSTNSLECHPLVCDLATTTDLDFVLDGLHDKSVPRLYTFFGMIPNFEPAEILPKLAVLVRSHDRLLFSANLAPGKDYNAGILQVLPLYDNVHTRRWLMGFLTGIGLNDGDGEIRFGIEADPAGSGLKRIVADFNFNKQAQILAEGERFEFSTGQSIRLFYSYRHTPDGMVRLLEKHGLQLDGSWITKSGEEGVFLCRRT